MDINIDINKIVCDKFIDIVDDIVNCNVDRVVLKGGRSSTKSQVASTSIIMGTMISKESAVAAVKYANKIEQRLVNTFRESINYLGVEKYWKLRKAPFEYVLLDEEGNETTTSIMFTGCDNADNLRSFKPRRGSFRYIWLEETTNFPSLKEVNNLLQTFARGKGKKCVIFSYNPPMQSSNWCNKEFNSVVSGNVIKHTDYSFYSQFDFEIEPGKNEKLIQVIHSSTYLDVIEAGHSDWLGSTFIGEAKKCEKENNKYYRWAYLGEVVGTDANVFNNLHTDWDGDTSDLDIEEVFRGYDWGYGGPDPCAYVAWYYDRKNKYIYALDDFSKPKMSIEEVAFELKERNKSNFPIYCDSANPLLNSTLGQQGINAENAIKGPDSVKAGIKFLQGLNGIFINKYKTPNIYKEFTEYEYFIDKEDNVTSKLIDKDNHSIDATRYALCLEIKYYD